MHHQSTPPIPNDKLKTCAVCGKEFARREGEANQNFRNRKMCKSTCRLERVPTNKLCRSCGKALSRRWNESYAHFERRQTCDRECGGLIRHLPAKVLVCAGCGQQFTKLRKQLRNGTRKYCTISCYHKSKVLSLEESRKVHLECQNPSCDNTWYSVPSQQGPFCSRTCDWQSRKWVSQTKYAKPCAVCGSTIVKEPSEKSANFRKRQTCSQECRTILKSRVRSATDIRHSDYPLEFRSPLKRLIRERDDYCCRECGIPESGRKHHVHHIDYMKDNCHPANLITLCNSCHGRTTNPTPVDRVFWITHYQAIVQAKCDDQELAA